ncbi:1,4-beta-xylanase [Paenibacillus polygoni]|uniref:1,4-beta-xylanase n=1 Tax=Paenibacillus polygoni TaxID=3050112 RepID=A0ABY8WXX0_9BACL|nr:1,4-beta-xylanase [Paenibacillus polygoni]WIV17478.1 1,4-beta-xylanase [Paenibacillus polygoni]
MPLELEYMKGFTFGWLNKKGDFIKSEAKESLRLMKERTNSNYAIFALVALQDTPHSTHVDYKGDHMVADEELIGMIQYARSLHMKVILKPTVNCSDGTWRAHINFFDLDVPCEPKWHDWFKSYTEYQLHYAKLAEAMNCEMLIVGCEMVQTERRSNEWRELISSVRDEYTGLISYNTDKYQESNVSWWDAVDVISSSGYYPIDDWERQLDRIEQEIASYDKPFFFAEAGCPSRKGSSYLPNDWELSGGVSIEEQARYYEAMIEHTRKRPWVRGLGLWDWPGLLYKEENAATDDGYSVYGKSAERVIKAFYQQEL